MSVAEKQANKVTAKELIEATRSWQMSQNEWNRVSDKADAYLRGLAADSKRTLVRGITLVSIARHLEGEAAEVKEETLKEGETGIDHTKEIKGELCDTLYYLSLFANARGLSVKDAGQDPLGWYERERFVKFEDDYTVADRIFLQCSHLAWTEKENKNNLKEVNDGFRWTLNECVAHALLLIIKFAERRGIDLDGSWKEKMAENEKRYLSQEHRAS